VFGDDAFVIPTSIPITSVMLAAVNVIEGMLAPVNDIDGMPEGLALDADAFSIPNDAPPACHLQAFEANACLQWPFLQSPIMLPAILCLQ